jgi:hypothetical protein
VDEVSADGGERGTRLSSDEPWVVARRVVFLN